MSNVSKEKKHRDPYRFQKRVMSVVAIVLCLSLVLPFKLLTVAAGVGAAVVGVLGLRRAAAAKARAFTRGMLVSGAVLGLAAGAMAVTPALFWNQSVQLERCLQEALTQRAAQQCQDEFTTAVTSWQPRFGG